jgi:hypothetical protein
MQISHDDANITSKLHNFVQVTFYVVTLLWVKWEDEIVATLLWVKWEDEAPTPKVGDLESSGTPERLEFDNRGQNTSHWDVLSVIRKVLKCRCPKCPRISHLDIYSPSYGQKKGWESLDH